LKLKMEGVMKFEIKFGFFWKGETNIYNVQLNVHERVKLKHIRSKPKFKNIRLHFAEESIFETQL
jgi:hypothetical protein